MLSSGWIRDTYHQRLSHGLLCLQRSVHMVSHLVPSEVGQVQFRDESGRATSMVYCQFRSCNIPSSDCRYHWKHGHGHVYQ